jgi:hypothetical protein
MNEIFDRYGHQPNPYGNVPSMRTKNKKAHNECRGRANTSSTPDKYISETQQAVAGQKAESRHLPVEHCCKPNDKTYPPNLYKKTIDQQLVRL